MSGSAIECIFCGKGAVGGSKDVKLYSGRDDDEYVHTIAVCNTCAARDSMGAESSTPVVPDPSSFPQGDGRVLGQQTDNSNLTPLHAESQMNEYEDFPRQNAEIGGVDFMGAEDAPSGDVIKSQPMDYAPAEDQLFSHCGCGMDVCGNCGSCCSCMCAEEYYAESPLEESPLDADPSTAGPSDMGGPEDFSAETQAEAAAMMSSHVVPAPLGRGVDFDLGAEDSDSQLVTINQPVLTGAKMALGVVALNATALIGISLIGMAIGAAAEKAREN
jgi:hypothetical protein